MIPAGSSARRMPVPLQKSSQVPDLRINHGGFYDVSPVVLEVPYDDYWYLVVDSNPRRIRAGVSQVFD